MTSVFVAAETGAIIPRRATSGSAGYDLCSIEEGTIPSLSRKTVSTGIQVNIPSGLYGRIAGRSGLAAKVGIDVFAGAIDSDYKGIIKVVLFNSGKEDYSFKVGERIAQLIFEKYYVASDIADTPTRGDGGFGSTGM